jgi:Leucine-rich repeat (LRR) protein
MRDNALESLETELICSGIRSIDFTCNLISIIPIDLFVFTHVTTVMQTHNSIVEIPVELVKWKIESFFISDNPMSSLRTQPDSLKEISGSNFTFRPLKSPNDQLFMQQD